MELLTPNPKVLLNRVRVSRLTIYLIVNDFSRSDCNPLVTIDRRTRNTYAFMMNDDPLTWKQFDRSQALAMLKTLCADAVSVDVIK